MNKIKFFVSGQVDSGKSTLIGNLLYKSGVVTKLDNSSSQATKFSDILDVDPSERYRGITQSSSNNFFTFNNIEYEAIDTPGHLLYIRELINSISSNKGSIGCILISAVKSEFDSMFSSGTTKEDVIIMRCCGVNHIICLINKIDKKNAIPDLVKDLFYDWISKLGFKSIQFCSISAYNGINLFERSNENEQCFIETLLDVNTKLNRTINHKIIKKKDKCKLDFYTFDFNKIIANGYSSIFHIVEHLYKQEIQCEIINIKSKETLKFKPFFKSNENIYLYIKLEESIDLFEKQRFILRDNNKTIGYGYIMFS